MHSKWLMAMPQVFGGIGLSLLALFAWNPFQQPLLQRAIAIEPKNIDFGELSAFDIGKATIVLTNRGREKMEFMLAFECDCTRAVPASGQIGPGEKFPITFSYRPRGSSDLKSINEELTNIQLKMRNAKSVDSVQLSACAKVIRPIWTHPNQTKIAANAFGRTPFNLNLSICSDVENVDVLSTPSFIRELIVHEPNSKSNFVVLQGDIVSPESAQKSIIELGVTLKGTDRTPIRISLPLELSVRDPFAVSAGSLQLVEKESDQLSVTPLGDCENVEVVEAKCDLPGTMVQITGSLIQVNATEISENQTGYLQLKLKCRGKDKSERLFSKYVLVQVSASDVVGLSIP